jgi:hypothetical protein
MNNRAQYTVFRCSTQAPRADNNADRYRLAIFSEAHVELQQLAVALPGAGSLGARPLGAGSGRAARAAGPWGGGWASGAAPHRLALGSMELGRSHAGLQLGEATQPLCDF